MLPTAAPAASPGARDDAFAMDLAVLEAARREAAVNGPTTNIVRRVEVEVFLT